MTGSSGAGGGFHHRSQYDKGNKPFKGKSKGKVKRRLHGYGRTEGEAVPLGKSSGMNSLGAACKVNRINHMKQIRDNKRKQAVMKNRQKLGIHGEAPRIVAFVGLSDTVDMSSFVEILSPYLTELNQNKNNFFIKTKSGKMLQVLTQDSRDPLGTLDLCKTADVVIPVFSITSDYINSSDESESRVPDVVDAQGDYLCSLICSQGLPALVPLILDSPSCSTKINKLAQKSASRYCETVFGEMGKKSKLFAFEKSKQDIIISELLRCAENVKLRDLHWRDRRCYMAASSILYDATTSELAIDGYLRGPADHILSANQLIHLTGYGDYQISRIERILPNGFDIIEIAEEGIQESLDALNDDIDEEDEEMDDEFAIKDEEVDGMVRMQKDSMGVDAADEMYVRENRSEDDQDLDALNVDEEEDDNLNLKFKMERDEMEFPDEVDAPTDVKARHRFRKYRGLENFHKSEWEEVEGEVPECYKHIYRFDDFHLAEKYVLSEASEFAASQPDEKLVARPGMLLRVIVKNVFSDAAENMFKSKCPVVLSALFKFERKVSVCHYKLQRYEGYGEFEDPIKGKEPVQFHCGFRRFIGRPIYSEEAIGCDKQKVEKFLSKGRFSIASMFARITFGQVNVLVFNSDCSKLIANGTFAGVDPDRLLIKRIVLTGYPFRVSKRVGVVRYMFFHPDDVRWFKPVKLWTKLGMQGVIEEPCGTKGLFKCSFNGYIKHHDTVCMSLYKRQFPPFQRQWFEDQQH